MSRLFTIARRELGSYFTSPIFWVLAAGFLAFTGLVFSFYVLSSSAQGGGQATMAPLLNLQGTVLLFITPLVSMRLLSEEQRSGTLEVLMTSPVHDWQVVWGKWLGAAAVMVVMIALTGFHVGVMSRLATNGMDMGPLITNYLALFLLSVSLLAVGVLTSSLTENQVVAGFLGVMFVMVLWFMGLAERITGGTGGVVSVLSYIGLSNHYLNFSEGTIDTRDVIYFVSLTVGALYLATRVLEARRWR